MCELGLRARKASMAVAAAQHRQMPGYDLGPTTLTGYRYSSPYDEALDAPTTPAGSGGDEQYLALEMGQQQMIQEEVCATNG